MVYMGLLLRGPEQGGFGFWVDYLATGNSGLALIDGFLASEEYAARFPDSGAAGRHAGPALAALRIDDHAETNLAGEAGLETAR